MFLLIGYWLSGDFWIFIKPTVYGLARVKGTLVFGDVKLLDAFVISGMFCVFGGLDLRSFVDL